MSHTGKLFSSLFVAYFITGCASITGTTNQSVSVQTRTQTGSEVASANCEMSNNKGKWYVTTPGSVMIQRSNDDLQAICRKDTYEPGHAAVVSATKGSMFGNIIFGGGIGAIIDHNNGSAYEYPNFIQVVMGSFSKIEPPPPPGDVQNQSNGLQSTSPKVTVIPNSPTPPPATQPSSSAAERPQGLTASAAPLSKEERLRELRALHEKGLVSPDAYAEQQKSILNSIQ
jgi:hypothetical protein